MQGLPHERDIAWCRAEQPVRGPAKEGHIWAVCGRAAARARRRLSIGLWRGWLSIGVVAQVAKKGLGRRRLSMG